MEGHPTAIGGAVSFLSIEPHYALKSALFYGKRHFTYLIISPLSL
jgi:hypothetical protein